MKSVFYISMFFLMALTGTVYGQQDSIKVEYTEESPDKSDFKLKEKYKYLHRRMVKEVSLFKISLLGFNVGVNDQKAWFLINTRGQVLAYERKLSPSFSVLYQNYNIFTLSPSLFAGRPQAHIFNSSTVGVRFYYDQRKQISRGRSANNFSGDYLSVQGDNIALVKINYKLSEISMSKPSLTFLYGIQRRLGKFGFFDVNAGMRYNKINYFADPTKPRDSKWEFIGNFMIGFGF